MPTAGPRVAPPAPGAGRLPAQQPRADRARSRSACRRPSRRRTPGLRREEVATLAGVGVTWYTWLEQGRDINASPQVLDAVARTLLLDPHERDHLFRLADTPGRQRASASAETLPPTAQMLLDQLEPFPACIRNARYDMLACNQAYEDLMGPLQDLPFEERNSLWRVFTSPAAGRHARLGGGHARMVAEYRAAMAEHVAEPAWKCLVSRLTKASPEFAELWERHEVASPENLTKRYLHPEVGPAQAELHPPVARPAARHPDDHLHPGRRADRRPAARAGRASLAAPGPLPGSGERGG